MLAVATGGCAAPRAIESRRSAHVVILPGIGGDDLFIERLRGLIEHEVPETSAQVWDWTRIEPHLSPFDLAELTDYPRNIRRARQLANQLVAWRADHPDSRLYLVGFSGGTGIVLFACRTLPEDFAVERTVLISSGLSSECDLSAALQRSRRGVFSYSSREDWIVLRDLTSRHGTMDRRFCPSGGYGGFTGTCDARFAGRLKQMAWTPAMRRLGNDGGHVGGLSPKFVREYFLPLFSDRDQRIPRAWRATND